ncbi:MAG: response regulator, partial [Gammaproteobacteria bacterium]|nr:response regulator [Gammaproteobacteria bacterium]
DIIMPGIDGYKAMSLIKEKPGMADVPIIMLTSRDKLIDKMRGKVSGTNEYLTKPFVYEELIGKIDKYLYTEDILHGDPAKN